MHNTNSDKLAGDVMNTYAEFEMHLYEKGPFPMIYFRAFFEAAVRYVELTKNSPMIHRNVASAINGLRNILELRSSYAPGQAISDADRLECMLFSEYDPFFEGDEPPGLDSRKHCISVWRRRIEKRSGKVPTVTCEEERLYTKDESEP